MKPRSSALRVERCSPEREPEPVLATDLFGETAAGEIVTGKRAGLRVPEVALVERRRGLEQLVGDARAGGAARPAAAIVSSYSIWTLKRSASHSIALGEVELLGLPDERDHVALRPAAEAVVELVHGVDREARRPLLVERAAAHVARAGLAQLSALGDDGDHVRCGLDLLDGCVLDPGHHVELGERSSSAKRSVIPAMKSTICSGSSPRSARCSKIRRTVARARSCSRARLRAEVDALEHERSQREHCAADLLALDDVAGAARSSRRGRARAVSIRREPPVAEQRDLLAREVGRIEDPEAHRVVDVVVDVGDAVDDPDDLALERRGLLRRRCA